MKNSTKTTTRDTSSIKAREAILTTFKKYSKKQLIAKHVTDEGTFSIRCLNDIIYNEKAHVVSVFKDYLIYDDMSEFLKRYDTID